MRGKRRWFHATDQWHGQQFQAKRRPPIIRAECEPATPRVCVSRYVIGCVSAVLFRPGKTVNVYRTVKPCRAYSAEREIWDAFLTREHWIWPPVEFELYSKIPAQLIWEIQSEAFLFYRQTGKACSLKIRARTLSNAARVLGPMYDEPFMVRAAERLTGLFGSQ